MDCGVALGSLSNKDDQVIVKIRLDPESFLGPLYHVRIELKIDDFKGGSVAQRHFMFFAYGYNLENFPRIGTVANAVSTFPSLTGRRFRMGGVTGCRERRRYNRDSADPYWMAASNGFTTVKRLQSYIKNVEEVRSRQPSDA